MTQPPVLTLPAQAAEQAEFIVNNLQQTDYQHDEHIDVDRGVYDCDCNGFAGFVLQRAAPDHYAMIPVEPGRTRPRAFKYYEFFHSLTATSPGGWHQIDVLDDVRRGDIIAWRLPESDILADENTGHVLIVADTPRPDGPGVFMVGEYDSASEPHFDDTRGTGPGQFPNGVGHGFLKFQVDDAGGPVAFEFTPAGQFTSLPIAIGRLEPLPGT